MNRNFKYSLSIFIGLLFLSSAPSGAMPLERLYPMQAMSFSGLKISVGEDQDKVSAGAKSFISSTTEQALDFLSDKTLSEKDRKAKFQKFLKTNFDMKTIGRFSLGRYWRVSTKKQKAEYLSLFEDMIVEVYSRRFGDYKGEEIKVTKVRMQSETDAIVTTYLLPERGNKIQIDWRVRYKSGEYRIVDIVVEGVSMALTQRSDFSSVIQRGGGQVDILLAHLRK